MSITTEEGVANYALYLMGEKGEITDLSGTDELSVLCNFFFDDVRDEVSLVLPWACLKTATALSVSAASNSRYTNYHTLAATVLRVLNINGDEKADFGRDKTLLYTNATSGFFEHTAQETTVANWEVEFKTAVATLLGSKIAVRKAGSAQLALMLYQQYLTQLMAAATNQHVEGASGEWVEMVAAMANYLPADLLAARPKAEV